MSINHNLQLYSLILVGTRIGSFQLQCVISMLNAENLPVETIRRLSPRGSLAQSSQSKLSSIQFLFKATSSNIKALTLKLKAFCTNYGLEFSIQNQELFKHNKKLIAFDLDSTLIQMEIIDELAAMAGKKKEVSRITELAMQGKLDFRQSLTQRVAFLQGLEKKDLNNVANSMLLTQGAQKLIAKLKEHGYLIAILSGGFTYFAGIIQEQLGIDYMFANELEICNTKLTGRVQGKIIDGPAKAQLLKHISEQQGICLKQTIAVGDGANDLPMLQLAGMGIAFHAKALLREKAEHNICFLGLDSIQYFLGIHA